MILPHQIMTCYGYRLPDHANLDWKRMAGTVVLRGETERQFVMELNFRDLPDGEVALRVTVADPSSDPDEWPPI